MSRLDEQTIPFAVLKHAVFRLGSQANTNVNVNVNQTDRETMQSSAVNEDSLTPDSSVSAPTTCTLPSATVAEGSEAAPSSFNQASRTLLNRMVNLSQLISEIPISNQTDSLPAAAVHPHLSATFGLSEEQRKLVGQWGEALVTQLVRAEHKVDSESTQSGDMDVTPSNHSYPRVTWCNADGESGLPYDITVETGPHAHQIVYIEVKSTRLGLSTPFQLSLNELHAALKYGAQYHIWRVCYAGTEQCTYCVMKHPLQHVKQEQAKLWVEIVPNELSSH